MFRGINPISLDNKGRMAMPAKYRERLRESCAGQLIVTIDPIECGDCLLIYPLNEWEEIERKLVRLSSTNKQARNLKRLLVGYAEECEMDAQGRILLPAPLRESAGLDKRVVLVGQLNKFELWDEQTWQRFKDECLEEKLDQGILPVDLESLSF